MAVGDRFIRIVLAVVLVALFFTKDFAAPRNDLLLVAGFLFSLTAFTGACPFYRLLGIDTRQFKTVD